MRVYLVYQGLLSKTGDILGNRHAVSKGKHQPIAVAPAFERRTVWIRNSSGSLAFDLKEGTVYPALHQLEKKGQIKSEWRTAENGRSRKYYSLTPKGKKTVVAYERQWQHLTGAMAAILESK